MRFFLLLYLLSFIPGLPSPGTCVRAQLTFSFLTEEQNAFVASEVRRLTLKQKAGQMTQVAVDLVFAGRTFVLTDPPRLDSQRINRIVGQLEIGSLLNHPSGTYPGPEEYRDYLGELQRTAMATTGVPILYGQHAIHGANYVGGSTLYAQPIGVAATFNVRLARELAALTAYELKAASIPWNFSPSLDLARTPNWSRYYETFGEDTYVNQEFGRATVAGYQGDALSDRRSVAACLKHFVGPGSPSAGLNGAPSYLPERQLRARYLPQFKAAIEAGALTLMVNSGDVNGVPVHASKRLLTDVLRGELGYEGLVVSDWQDVRYLHERHRVTRDLKESVRVAIDAGLDLSMTAITTDFPAVVVELVQEGQLTEARIDSSVARILAVKVALGLYEQHLWDPAEFPEFGGEDHGRKSLQAAEESIVLLKNDGLQLPIRPEQRILVVGPTANTMRSLNGGWTYSWQGNRADDFLGGYNTILEALEREFPDRVTYAQGATFDTLRDVDYSVRLAANADLIVVCLGELSYSEDPGNIGGLFLPTAQRQLFNALAETGKPIVLIMAAGRPRMMTGLSSRARSVLFLPYPGPRGGDALAGILSGRVNPSGRLRFSYPRESGRIVSYDHKPTEGRNGGYHPLFPFGHGLSYTDFTYSDVEISSRVMRRSDTLTCSIRVTNAGDRAGRHSVLLYTSDEVASVTPSIRRLRRFTKLHLEPGESRTVTFELTADDLSFVNQQLQSVTEEGTFRIHLGNTQLDFDYEDR